MQVVDPTTQYDSSCLQVIIPVQEQIAIQITKSASSTFKDTEVLDKYVEDGSLRTTIGDSLFTVCHSVVADISNMDISVNSEAMGMSVQDGLTTSQRNNILITGNKLRIDQSIDMAEGTEMTFRARAKSTVNNILASAYVQIKLVVCPQSNVLSLKTGLNDVIFRINTGNSFQGIISQSSATDLSEADFYRIFEFEIERSCLDIKVVDDYGSGGIVWNTYNNTMTIDTNIISTASKNISFGAKLPSQTTYTTYNVMLGLADCSSGYLTIYDKNGSYLGDVIPIVLMPSSMYEDFNLLDYITYSSSSPQCFPNTIKEYTLNGSKLKYGFDSMPINLKESTPQTIDKQTISQTFMVQTTPGKTYLLKYWMTDYFDNVLEISVNIHICSSKSAEQIVIPKKYTSNPVAIQFVPGQANSVEYNNLTVPQDNGIQVFNLNQLINITTELPDDLSAQCLTVKYELYENDSCQTLSNSSQIEIQDYQMQTVDNNQNTSLWNQTDLVIRKTNTAAQTFVFNVKAYTTGGFSQCIQFNSTVCGLEKIFSIGTGVTQIDVAAIFGTIIEMDVQEQQAYFDLSNHINECSLKTEITFLRDGNLSDAQYGKFLHYKNSSQNSTLVIDPSGFTSSWPVEESIWINLTSSSGVKAQHKIIFSFQTAYDAVQAALDLLNKPPQIFGAIEVFEVNITKDADQIKEEQYVSFLSQEIVDFEGDQIQITFDLDQVQDIIEIKQNPQEENKMTFEVRVDRYKIKEEDYGKNLTFEAKFNDHLKTSEPFEFTIYVNGVVIKEIEAIKGLLGPANEASNSGETQEQKEGVQDDEQDPYAVLAKFGIFYETKQDQDENNTFKGVEIIEVKEEEPTEPSISVQRISPLGELTIQFNQDFFIPKDWEDIDYSKVFIVGLRSGDDNSLVMGHFAKTGGERRILRGGKTKNLLSIISDCMADECDAQSKQFEWSVTSHTQRDMKIQMGFDSPNAISKSTGGQDKIHFSIKLLSYFRSKQTDIVLKTKNIASPVGCAGGAMICNTIPPIMKSQQDVDTVTDGASTVGSSIGAVATGNFLVAIMLKGAVQQLMGMIRLLQLMLLQAIIKITYPSHVNFFYQICVMFADMDLLHGPYWYDRVFNFRVSGAYNSKFYDFGMEDLNFYSNSGSILIISLFIILNAILWKSVVKLSKKYYKYPKMRKLGMFANDGTSIRTPLLVMTTEGYTDLILSGFVGLYEVVYSFSSMFLFKKLFEDFSNTFLTISTIVVTVAMIILPFYVKHQLQKNFENLEKQEVKEKYQVFYSEYRTKTRNQAIFGYYSMLRKIILVLILLILDDYPWAQGILIFINTTIFLFSLIIIRPYQSGFTQKMEIWNETIVLLGSHINLNFLLQAPPETEENLEKLKDNVGWFLIALIIMNILSNVLIVGLQSLCDIFLSMKKLRYQLSAIIEKRRQQQASKYLLQSVDAGISTYRRQIKEQEALEFCKKFSKERKWCYQNGLDYRVLDEEKLFQKHVQKFAFKAKRAEVIEQVTVYQEVQKLIKNERDKRIFQNVDEKMQKISFQDSNETQKEVVETEKDVKIETKINLKAGISKKKKKKKKKKKVGRSKGTQLLTIKEDPDQEDNEYIDPFKEEIKEEKTLQEDNEADTMQDANQNDQTILSRRLMFQTLKEENLKERNDQMKDVQDRIALQKRKNNQFKEDQKCVDDLNSLYVTVHNVHQEEDLNLDSDVTYDSEDEQIINKKLQIQKDHQIRSAIEFELLKQEKKKERHQKSQKEKLQILNALDDKKKGNFLETIQIVEKLIKDYDEHEVSQDDMPENYDFAIDYEFEEEKFERPLEQGKEQPKAQVSLKKQKKKPKNENLQALGLVCLVKNDTDQGFKHMNSDDEMKKDSKDQNSLPFLLQCLLETPFLKNKLSRNELDYQVNHAVDLQTENQDQKSLSEQLQSVFLRSFSDYKIQRNKKTRVKFNIDQIVKRLKQEDAHHKSSAEQEIFTMLQKIHEECKVQEAEKLKFNQSMNKNATLLREQFSLQTFLICNQSMSFISRNLTQLIRNTHICQSCSKETITYTEQIMMEMHCEMNQELIDAVRQKLQGHRQVMRACQNCNQLRMQSIYQHFLVTPEVFIVMITDEPHVNFKDHEIKAIEQLNNELVSKAPRYRIPEQINQRDLKNMYHDDYRQLTELISSELEDISVENVNKILSPADSFSIQDQDFNYEALKNKLEPINKNHDLNFEFVGETVNLSSLVDTLHVEDLNESQEQRYQAEKTFLDNWDMRMEKATVEERVELLNLRNKDESDKRTVEQHYPRLRTKGFEYQLYAIYSQNHQAYVKKDMPADTELPAQWYVYGPEETDYKKVQKLATVSRPEFLFFKRC